MPSWLDSPTVAQWLPMFFVLLFGAMFGVSWLVWRIPIRQRRQRNFQYAKRLAELSVERYGPESVNTKRDISAAIDAWKEWQCRDKVRDQDSWLCTPADTELFRLQQCLVPANTSPC